MHTALWRDNTNIPLIGDNMINNAEYIKVEAAVRYWDDAHINGDPDYDGDKTPFRVGDLWCPTIRISDGMIEDWPQGVKADFHFKVCDAGMYYLLNNKKQAIADRMNDYVPSGLCHGDKGYGDYIIFSVGDDGFIENYKNLIDFGEWQEIPF